MEDADGREIVPPCGMTERDATNLVALADDYDRCRRLLVRIRGDITYGLVFPDRLVEEITGTLAGEE